MAGTVITIISVALATFVVGLMLGFELVEKVKKAKKDKKTKMITADEAKVLSFGFLPVDEKEVIKKAIEEINEAVKFFADQGQASARAWVYSKRTEKAQNIADRILKLLINNGFRGYVNIEHEKTRDSYEIFIVWGEDDDND